MSACAQIDCAIVRGFADRIAKTKGSKKLIGLARPKTERKPLYIFGKNMMTCAQLNEKRGIVRLIPIYEACLLTNFGFAVASRLQSARNTEMETK